VVIINENIISVEHDAEEGLLDLGEVNLDEVVWVANGMILFLYPDHRSCKELVVMMHLAQVVINDVKLIAKVNLGEVIVVVDGLILFLYLEQCNLKE
jgi:hypothetical protein